MSHVGTITRTQAIAWGEQTAARLDKDWLARIWHVDSAGALLVDVNGNVVRVVPESIGNASFYLVLGAEAPDLGDVLQRDGWAWRVGDQLWFGDSLTIQLPSSPPWRSHVKWDEPDVDRTTLTRRLHWLADTVMARAPEGTFAGVLPDLLVDREIRDHRYLDGADRLMRWRAGRVLNTLMPALENGDMAVAEQYANRAAGLGPGSPPAGDQFLIGLIAGMRLWPDLLQKTGLNVEPALRRMVVGASDRTNLLGWTLIQNALIRDFSGPWHHLFEMVCGVSDHPPTRRRRLRARAIAWLDRPDGFGVNGLAGFLLPFLWEQRQVEVGL